MAASPLSGQRLGAYDVGPLIGAGGMGEVYRARDSRLNRDVAVKVLLPAVASDAERLARFRREAQVLASLNHSGIAQIYGIEDSSAGPFLVMELIEGPTLADRIAKGPLPIDDALAIAKQIADGLEAAHERGIVHRDLKPANIKVDDHGTVKVLDFGLARAVDPQSSAGGDLANSPTITSPAMTQAGMILGTAAYMSPEQAKGRSVDKRSDVWAFGCVLYEMLTGQRAFGGEDVTETIAAVVRGEPDWTKLPASTPSQIRLLLKRCLEKDRKARIADISTARFLIDEKLDASASAGPLVSRGVVFAAATIVVALIGASAWLWSSAAAPAAPAVVRFEIRPPGSARMALGQSPPMAIAPDGSFVVYRAVRSDADERQADVLMIRESNQLDSRELPETRLARGPFVSPDGKWIGFFGAGWLRKVPVAGGQAVDIADFAGAPFGASWGDDGYIVFASSEVDGLQRVSAEGGEITRVTTPARAGAVRHILPHVLPGSRFVLFTEADVAQRTTSVHAVEVATGASTMVMAGAHQAAYSETGHLVYGIAAPQVSQQTGRATVRAARFDITRAETVGDAVTMVEPVGYTATMVGTFAVSRSGVLVYLPEVPAGQSRVRHLVWVDRKGEETPIAAPPGDYGLVRISPDGTKVVTDVVRQNNPGIWIWDFNRQTLTPVNQDAALNSVPVWMPDSRRVLWSSTRSGEGGPKLFSQAADGTGTAAQISTGGGTHFATSVSADGRTVLMFTSADGGSGSFDLAAITLGGAPASPVTMVSTPRHEFGAELSPDGKWLAYHSFESGESQVYVRPYPNVNAARWQISNAGGSRAAWSRSGRELFYLNRQGMLTSVAVLPSASGEFRAGLPAQILKIAYVPGRTTLGLDVRGYDVSPDGQRFLMLKEANESDGAQPPRLAVVLNWAEELKARLP